MKEFVNNRITIAANNNNNVDKKKAKLDYVAWNSQQECGGYKSLYGTQYCEQRLICGRLSGQSPFKRLHLSEEFTPAMTSRSIIWQRLLEVTDPDGGFHFS